MAFYQVTRRAAERDEEDRRLYQWVIGTGYRAEQTVFVDESACDQRTPRRRYAWAYVGNRSAIRDSFHRGEKYVFKLSSFD
jgi:hypothetical protein